MTTFYPMFLEQRLPLEQCYSNHEERNMLPVRPMLSPDEILKLHTDGSSRGNPGPSSFGGLIRDSEGKWVCGYMGRMKGRWYTSLEAEVWSIYNGLCLIREKNLSNLLIVTDCETILRLGGTPMDPDLKIVMDAIETIKIERNCALMHTRRAGNQCADLLANLGGRQSEEYMVLEEPPAELIPYLLEDIEMGRHR